MELRINATHKIFLRLLLQNSCMAAVSQGNLWLIFLSTHNLYYSLNGMRYKQLENMRIQRSQDAARASIGEGKGRVFLLPPFALRGCHTHFTPAFEQFL